jgi:hypothetical protein
MLARPGLRRRVNASVLIRNGASEILEYTAMAAQFYCWDPALGLSPDDADFEEAIIALHEMPQPKPAPGIQSFVSTLVWRFAGLTNRPSATGPLEVQVIGGFVGFVVSRSHYSETRPVLIETARQHGLNCYDLQDGQLYPARLH